MESTIKIPVCSFLTRKINYLFTIRAYEPAAEGLNLTRLVDRDDPSRDKTSEFTVVDCRRTAVYYAVFTTESGRMGRAVFHLDIIDCIRGSPLE
jgi:hypothetical protein